MGTIPILLPMPQFTAEQIANMQKLQQQMLANTNTNANGNAEMNSSVNSSSSSTEIRSSLKPKMPSFKPSIKSVKLEDIKEDDEEEEDFDEEVEPQSVCLEPSECLESLRADLLGDECEDEWVEIAGLDEIEYPATLWCLHAKSFSAAPECSLEKLQSAMASALLSS